MLICNTFWFVFVDTFTTTRNLATASMAILSKVKFATEALYVAGVLKVLFNLLLQLIAVLLVMIFFDIRFEWQVFAVILPVLGLILAGTALGFLVLPFVTLVKDLNNLIVTLVGLWFFATPIIYPVNLEGALGAIAKYNPMTPLIITAKQCITGDSFTMLPQCFLVMAVFLTLSLFGLVLQRLALPILVERMNA
jgi:lipopolysaccharide transport system permease protein